MKKVILTLIFITSMLILSTSVYAWSEYKIGQKVKYNGIDYYVIKDSGTNEDSVTMLKAEPLSYEEIQEYSNGTGATLDDVNGYGGMQYGETSTYSTSYVKQVVDAWAAAKVLSGVSEVRLLAIDELSSLGYEWKEDCDTCSNMVWKKTGDVPRWLYNINYIYWTMTPKDDSVSDVWRMNVDGVLAYGAAGVYYNNVVVRPVIIISKTALGDVDDSKKDNNKEATSDNKYINKETTTKVNVANTYLKQSIIVIILGFICAGIGIFIYYKLSNKKK